MDVKCASKLLSENLTSIYGYAASRLYDLDGAEDLAGEIICEVLESICNLKDDGAFWGFTWKIAENTFRKYIRRSQLRRKSEEYADDHENMGTIWANFALPSPEEAYIENSEKSQRLYLIRRELSLLTKTKREVTVAYYIHGKGCKEIADEQNLSVEMVKYYLFRTRKQLKEGYNMERKLGEKSYDPGVFRINFWGDWNHYNDFFDRKIRGAIALAAYYVPLTAEEISVELGVSMPYLEEEIEALEAAGILLKTGNKYQTNLVIVTDAYEKELARKTEGIYHPIAEEIFKEIKELLPEVRKLDFAGKDFDDNRLLFAIYNIAMVKGYEYSKNISPLGDYPKLKLGGNGWIYGHDNDYVNMRFTGVTMHTNNADDSVWFSAENYIIIEPCQHYEHWRFIERANAMWDAILEKPADENNPTVPELIDSGIVSSHGGRLHANFPVFKKDVYNRLTEEILQPVSVKISELMLRITDIAADMLKTHAPAAVADQCKAIASIHHGLDVGAILLEDMIKSGLLTLPKEKVPLCIFGVKK